MSKEGGRRGRDDGMSRAIAAANPVWVKGMRKCIRIVAHRQAELSADDVFALAKKHKVEKTHENRAFGPLMKEAEREGYIEITSKFVSCERTSRHVAPLRVWKSLVHGGQPLISKHLRTQRILLA